MQLHWFRRDLRLDDNPSLAAALDGPGPVACVFVLDERVVRGEDRAAVRVSFLLQGLRDLEARLRRHGGGLVVCAGDPAAEIPRLTTELGATAVHACADDEPVARARDHAVADALAAVGVSFVRHHDQTLVEHDRIATSSGGQCRTYSAYARAVARTLQDAPVSCVEYDLDGRVAGTAALDLEGAVRAIGVETVPTPWPGGESAALARLRAWRDGGLGTYAARRDAVGDEDATSLLSAYLKLGMVSPRRCRLVADRAGARKWAAELLWRDWFKYVLHHHPELAERAVDPRFERVPWPGGDAHYEAWTRGETGFGLVDAGMRQLVETGFMPNRVRMAATSFLVKHLHVDWRRGERFFRDHLVDGDLSSNAGNAQWVAGTGLDAAPYFRIFNPLLQERKFDPNGDYVRRWAPDRPAPIVDLARERARALELYARAKTSG